MEDIENLDDVTKNVLDPLNRKKKVGNYLLGKIIGEGSFAKVRQGLHIIAREKVAVKIVAKRTVLVREYVKRSVRREAVILQRLEHSNIVRLYEIMETENSYYLVMELAEYGEFIKYLSEKQRLEEPECRKYIRQMTSALDHMHMSNITHRDLKLENLLLDKDLNLKIIDFGLSNVFYGDTSLSTQCGSPVYAAPEIFCSRKYGPAVDVWSMGICMYAMLTGKLPFLPDPPNNLTALHTMILKGAPVPENISSDCSFLLARLLTVDAHRRIKVEEILSHPWVLENHASPLITRQPPIGKLYPLIPKPVIVNYMTSVFSFIEDDVFYSVIERKMNAVAAAYHLLLKRYEAGLQLIGFTGHLQTLNSYHNSTNSRNREENNLNGNARFELPVLKPEQSIVSDSEATRATYKSYLQHLKDSKLKSAPNLRTGNHKHKDISLRRHKTKPEIAKFSRTREETGFLPDFMLTYTHDHTQQSKKFEWEQTFVVSRKEPTRFDSSSYSRTRSLLSSSQSKTRISTSDTRFRDVEFSDLDNDVSLGADIPVPPTTPATPFHRDRPFNSSAYSRVRSESGTTKLNLELETIPILDPCNGDSWNTFNKQKNRLSRGVTMSTKKSSIAYQYGVPITKPKNLTPREAKSYYEEFEQAQVVGQGRRLIERSKTTTGKVEDLHSIWTRKTRTANGRREFPDIASSIVYGSRPPTQELPFRTVDASGVIQFPDVQHQSAIFEGRVDSPEKETIVGGVTDVIKVQITGSAKT